MGCNAGYGNAGFPLLKYLVPQAVRLEPVLGYVQAPFMRMLEDFYYLGDEEMHARWPTN
jgi:hypothetical protein